MAKVTGIGGIFFRSPDPQVTAAWYTRHLGIEMQYGTGTSFDWKDEGPAGTGTTAWSIASETAAHLGEPQQRAMVNYRVDDLDALLQDLAAAGVWIDPKRDSAEYGHFAWIKDCDGNRVELWQPL